MFAILLKTNVNVMFELRLLKKNTLKGQGTDQPTTDYRLTDKENKNNQQPKLLQI